jgi:membrane peptidoglycan carboxypeptidase
MSAATSGGPRRRRAGLASRPAVATRLQARAGTLTQLRRRRASVYRRGRRQPGRRRLVKALLIALAAMAATGASTVGAVFAGYTAYKSQLPDAATVAGMEPAQDSYVYDAAGNVIHIFHDPGFRHVHVALKDISHWLQRATIDVEDRHFYDEGSWDLPRLVAAGVNNLTHNGATQGASTITEQLAKISLYGGATPPRSIDYKIKEIVLGNEIELNFPQKPGKDQILEMYLNRIYYGNHATGIETAAELFFHKPASALDLAEASLLAGLPKSPGLYNPFACEGTNCINQLAKQRQRDVLSAMVSNGDISLAQEHEAYIEPLTLHLWSDPDAEPNLDPSFVQFLEGWLRDNYGDQYLKPGGWRIYTTLDPGKQALADKTVHDQVNKVANLYNMHDGALVNIDPKTGEVLAMVGAANYDDPSTGQVNFANVPIIPGSTIKLFTYTAAIASGKYNMTTPILDAPYTFPGHYSPFDYDRRWHGTCELKQCLGNSFNMPAVKVEYSLGIDYVTNLEIAMGVKSLGDVKNRPAPTQWAATLGSLSYGIKLVELADGAATIADMGIHHDPVPATKIVDGVSGRTIFKYDPIAAGHRVIPDNVAFIMNEITSNDNNRLREFGAHGPLTLGDRRVSAKTGTADYFLDNLTVGWTPDLLTAVWVGNGTRSCLDQTSQASVTRVKSAMARGDIIEAGQSDAGIGYPFSPGDLKHYGVKPVNGNCGHLDGIVSGYSGAAPIWHQFMDTALKGTPKNWYARPADIVASGSGDDANFFLPGAQNPTSGCFYWGPAPDPSNPCTYSGTAPPPGYVAPAPPSPEAVVPTPRPKPCKKPPCG